MSAYVQSFSTWCAFLFGLHLFYFCCFCFFLLPEQCFFSNVTTTSTPKLETVLTIKTFRLKRACNSASQNLIKVCQYMHGQMLCNTVLPGVIKFCSGDDLDFLGKVTPGDKIFWEILSMRDNTQFRAINGNPGSSFSFLSFAERASCALIQRRLSKQGTPKDPK